MIKPERSEIDGYVLAGGRSSRMGHDKATLKLSGGRTLVEHAANALQPICRRLHVVAKEKAAAECGFDGLRFVPDIEIPETSHASIVGLRTALSHAETDWIAVIACDLPFASGELFSDLAQLRSAQFDAIVPRQPDGRPQPLCAIYRRDATLSGTGETLRSGDLRIGNLLKQVRTLIVPFEEFAHLGGSSQFFLNLNTPDEYAAALSLARQTARSESN